MKNRKLQGRVNGLRVLLNHERSLVVNFCAQIDIKDHAGVYINPEFYGSSKTGALSCKH